MTNLKSKAGKQLILYLQHLPQPQRTSIRTVQRSIRSELSSPTAHAFVPFVQERNGIGQLLSSASPPPERSRQQASSPAATAAKLPKMLLKRKPLLNLPCIGSYFKPLDWGKPAVGRLPRKQELGSPSAPPSPQCRQVQTLGPVKSSSQKAVTSNVPTKRGQRAPGIWESMEIKGTPKDLQEILSFARERELIEKCLQDNKTVSNELKRYLFLYT